MTIIGKGSFGSVTYNKRTKNVTKRVNIAHSKVKRSHVANEIATLKKLGLHPNIIQYVSHKICSTVVTVCYKYGGVTLHQIMTRSSKLNTYLKIHDYACCDIKLMTVDIFSFDIRDVTQQMLSAIHFIHSKGMIHADLKSDNVVFNPVTRNVKIIDFGAVRRLNENGEYVSSSGELYANAYRNPVARFDIDVNRIFSPLDDMWAFGCIVYELCHYYYTQKPFIRIYEFTHEDKVDLVNNFNNYLPQINEYEQRLLMNTLRAPVNADVLLVNL